MGESKGNLQNMSVAGIHARTRTPVYPPLTSILSQHPPSYPTHRYEVCFLNASPLNFSSSVSCSMSGRLLNVSLQQPTPASSEPAPDSESPPSAPREARRPLKPPVAGLVVRSFAWGSMLVGPRCLSPRAGPPSPPGCEGTQMPVALTGLNGTFRFSAV